MGKIAIVTYKIKDGQVAKNKKLIEAVFSKLKETDSSGIKYASTIGEDKLTFTHIAFFESPEGQKALSESPEFKEFQRDLKARCEIPPKATFMEIVDSYQLF